MALPSFWHGLYLYTVPCATTGRALEHTAHTPDDRTLGWTPGSQPGLRTGTLTVALAVSVKQSSTECCSSLFAFVGESHGWWFSQTCSRGVPRLGVAKL